MNDEIDYAESLRKRAALLEGLPAEDAQAAFEKVELREGAADLIAELNESGVTTAILTGGFEKGVATALEREGVSVDHIVSNRLPMDDAETELTGDVTGSLIEGTKDTASRTSRATSTRPSRTASPSATARTTSRCSRSPASQSASSRNRPSNPTVTSSSPR